MVKVDRGGFLNLPLKEEEVRVSREERVFASQGRMQGWGSPEGGRAECNPPAYFGFSVSLPTLNFMVRSFRDPRHHDTPCPVSFGHSLILGSIRSRLPEIAGHQTQAWEVGPVVPWGR